MRTYVMLFDSQETHYNPVILYECYRNGTTFEAEGSVNVSVFFDGTRSPPGEVGGFMYYSVNATPSTIVRYVTLVKTLACIFKTNVIYCKRLAAWSVSSTSIRIELTVNNSHRHNEHSCHRRHK